MPLHGVVTCECPCGCWYLYCLCADQDADIETPQEKPYLHILVNVPTSDGNCSDDPIPNATYYNFKQFTTDDNELLREGCYKFHEVTENPPLGAYLIDSDPEFKDELQSINNCWGCLGMGCEGSGSGLPTKRNIKQAIALNYELTVEFPEREIDSNHGCFATIFSIIEEHEIVFAGSATGNGGEVRMALKAEPDMKCDNTFVAVLGGWGGSCKDGPTHCGRVTACAGSGGDAYCYSSGPCCSESKPCEAPRDPCCCDCEFSCTPPGDAPSVTGYTLKEKAASGDNCKSVQAYWGPSLDPTEEVELPNGDKLKRHRDAEYWKTTCPTDQCSGSEDCCPLYSPQDECGTTVLGNTYARIGCCEEPLKCETVAFQIFHRVLTPWIASWSTLIASDPADCNYCNDVIQDWCCDDSVLENGVRQSGSEYMYGTFEDGITVDIPIEGLDKSVCDD